MRFLASTVHLIEWRTKFQRRKNVAENAATAARVDSLLNFETVKNYGTEEYEVDKYRDHILVLQVRSLINK